MTHGTLASCKKLVPPLLSKFHKGQLGRILVVGGSIDYTGAPYFSCMASALTGSDMNHILCSEGAGTVIKGYSPNLMVHPYLREDSPKFDDRIPGLLDRIHVVVVGPGLGRDKGMIAQAKQVIEHAKQRKIPTVIDADGLWFVGQDLGILKGGEFVLTPNVVEFQRLLDAANIDGKIQKRQQAEMLASKLQVAILVKGDTDILTDGQSTLFNDTQGSNRRVSGQGDTLSGTLATFLAWTRAYKDDLWETQAIKEPLTLVAMYAASSLTRTASRVAFERAGRGMVTTDVTESVPAAFKQLFE